MKKTRDPLSFLTVVLPVNAVVLRPWDFRPYFQMNESTLHGDWSIVRHPSHLGQ